MHVLACKCAHQRSEDNFLSWFSPSVLWILSTELRLSDLVASVSPTVFIFESRALNDWLGAVSQASACLHLPGTDIKRACSYTVNYGLDRFQTQGGDGLLGIQRRIN